jgi:hypothetical protein
VTPRNELLRTDELKSRAARVLGAALASTLHARGWTLLPETEKSFCSFQNGDSILDPFEITFPFANGTMQSEEWIHRREAMGIADWNLSQQAVNGSPAGLQPGEPKSSVNPNSSPEGAVFLKSECRLGLPHHHILPPREMQQWPFPGLRKTCRFYHRVPRKICSGNLQSPRGVLNFYARNSSAGIRRVQAISFRQKMLQGAR